ncbi:MAG TPA: hypothetical protein DCE41_36880 [Cytophagales bacterium]|nr:hypothetical protein [Cytophagales bacterium]HAA23458.1 hypothetical protein [Cytophagales bacterium]HAP60665.1 hypothetical protein [Cytophagales bacterium]
METVDYTPPKDLEPYINCVMVQKSVDPGGHTNIPLYADGYPGIMWQQAEEGFYLLPKGKKLSEFFLYGQTLEPVSLDAQGPFSFVVFQLYPFASKYLLGVDPRVLNDDCYDLLALPSIQGGGFHEALLGTENLTEQTHIIAQVMRTLLAEHRVPEHDLVQLAIHKIIQAEGQVSVREVLEEVPMTERTLERQFQAQVGLTPKQFAKIIQFQKALHSLNQSRYDRLVEVGVDSGFADQSHFIRTFKRYTGQTPSYYLRHQA